MSSSVASRSVRSSCSRSSAIVLMPSAVTSAATSRRAFRAASPDTDVPNGAENTGVKSSVALAITYACSCWNTALRAEILPVRVPSPSRQSIVRFWERRISVSRHVAAAPSTLIHVAVRLVDGCHAHVVTGPLTVTVVVGCQSYRSGDALPASVGQWLARYVSVVFALPQPSLRLNKPGTRVPGRES
eukprot:365554-Chlamydomonas_euryale.AAC.8